MNSVSTRLFAAFLGIILLVIAIVSFVLIVLLRNNPLVQRQTITRLNNVALDVARQDLLPANATAGAARPVLQHIVATYGLRALVTTAAGDVLFDSAAPSQAAINFRRFRSARREAAFPGSLVGQTRDEQRRLWYYAARPLGSERMLVLAEQPAPFQALMFFAENLLLPLVEAAVVAALVAMVLAVLISRSIALPLQKMALLSRGIAQGDYRQAAPVSGPNEVRALGEAFNSMALQVQATQQAQREFLANVSHELKTPLTSIQGFAQAMVDGTVDSPSGVQRSAGIIYGESERMRHLVEGLLDLARLEASLRGMARGPVDVGAAVAATVERFSQRAADSGVALKADLPAGLPLVMGDADRLAQVFSNLLDNALKHTPEGGSVSVAALAAAGAVEVSVADTGAGIPAEDLGRIFERFYQVDKSRARSGGVGLGLAISKEIVEAHGGSLRVESTLGAGSQFTVRLPAAAPADVTAVRRR